MGTKYGNSYQEGKVTFGQALKNKVAIVTGASHGIGKGVALEIGKQGANVVVVCGSDIEAGNKVGEKIKEMSQEAIVVKADVTDSKQVKDLTKAALNTFGKIDILVNCAGIVYRAPFWEMSEADWDRVMDVHVKGTYNCVQAVVKNMMERQSGKIINVTARGGMHGTAKHSAYATAKGGIIALTRTLAKELAPYKINVNAIAPMADTRMLNVLKEDSEYWEVFVKKIPLSMPQPEDIAPAFAFLASDAANFITGQVLCVDGGYDIME